MPKQKEISIEDRAQIVADLRNGIPVSEIAEKYQCHRNSIRYQMKKYLEYGSVRNKHRKGRNRITSPKEDNKILRKVKVNPALTGKQLTSEINFLRQEPVSSSTVRRRLKESGIKAYVAQKKPYISKKNRAARYQFALQHKNKPPEFWRSILWTDESAFSLDGSYRRTFFYSKQKEKQVKAINIPTRHSKGGKIMIWGCISYNGIGPITSPSENMTAAKYLEILNNIALVAGCRLIDENFILQHDNAPIHTSKIIKKFLKGVGQEVLQWPPQSPDLNVIENMWSIIKSKISVEIGRSKEAMWEEIVNIWANIENDTIRSLIDSMPRRIHEVLKSKGGNTSY